MSLPFNTPLLDIPAAVYHAHPSLSNSLLKHLGADNPPLDFWHHSWLNSARVFDADDTKAKKFGRAAHMLLLEGEAVFKDHWTMKPKVKETTEAGKLGEGEWTTLLHIRDVLLAHPLVATILKGARSEVSMLASLMVEDMQVPVRCRHDIWKPGYSADIKFVETVTKREVASTIAAYGYERQAEWYPRIMGLCGHSHNNFITIFVAKQPPHHVLCVTYPDDVIGDARERNDAALRRYVDYQALYGAAPWPGFAPHVHTVYRPGSGDADGLTLPNWWQYQ